MAQLRLTARRRDTSLIFCCSERTSISGERHPLLHPCPSSHPGCSSLFIAIQLDKSLTPYVLLTVLLTVVIIPAKGPSDSHIKTRFSAMPSPLPSPDPSR